MDKLYLPPNSLLHGELGNRPLVSKEPSGFRCEFSPGNVAVYTVEYGPPGPPRRMGKAAGAFSSCVIKAHTLSHTAEQVPPHLQEDPLSFTGLPLTPGSPGKDASPAGRGDLLQAAVLG